MIVRTWMTQKAKEEITEVATHLPVNIVEQAINLIENMDKEANIDYRCRIVNIIYRTLNEKHFHFSCSESLKYDAFHEFCLFLDGWIWTILGNDSEHGSIRMVELTNE